jgi:hypothetical protein
MVRYTDGLVQADVPLDEAAERALDLYAHADLARTR